MMPAASRVVIHPCSGHTRTTHTRWTAPCDRATPPRHASAPPFLPWLLLLLATAAAAADSNKWRLQCSGGAGSDGVIGLRLVPRGGEPIDVAVSIAKGTGENAVARALRDALKAQVSDRYRSEVDDGEDVLVKKRGGQPDFELVVYANTVKGVRIGRERE